MRNSTLTVLAVAAILLLAAGGVTAHDNNENTTNDAPVNGSAADWATWMEQHMIEHMGVDAAAQMQERMGMSYEEMGEHMAAHHEGSMADGMMNGRMMGEMMNGGMSGMGCH